MGYENVQKIESGNKYFIITFYLIFLALLFIYKNYFKSVLTSSMPFREMYSPTHVGIFIFYLIPFIWGYYIGRINYYSIQESEKPILTILYLSLAHSLYLVLPFWLLFITEIALDMYLFITVAYLFILIPILMVIGFILNFVKNDWELRQVRESERDKRIVILSLILILLLIGLVNYIPVILSKYPVGMDVYYHAALTETIKNGKSPFNSPLFYEGTNCYTPFVYYIIIKISDVANISTLNLWRFYPAVISPLVIISLFYLSKYLTKSYISGILTVIFVLPWYTILLTDPSPRLFAVFLLLLSLLFFSKGLNENRKYLIISWVLFILTWLSHIEIGVHITIVIFASLVFLKYFQNIQQISNRVLNITGKKTTAIKLTKKEFICLGNKNSVEMKFSILLILYTVILSSFIIKALNDYGIRNLGIFNEIALSFLVPIGSISFIVFLFALPSFVIVIKHRTVENSIILSLLFLYTSVLFYFTLQWQFYHRYFAEVAYIGLSILAAVIIPTFRNTKIKNILILSIIILFLFSIIPRIEFTMQYTPVFERSIDNKIEILNFIKKIDGDVVILANPDDIINRYIPAITGKYIFSGRMKIDQKQQWTVIPSTFIAQSAQEDALRRVELAYGYFNGSVALDEILKKYRITHVLINENNNINTQLENSINLDIIARKDGYILMQINPAGAIVIWAH